MMKRRRSTGAVAFAVGLGIGAMTSGDIYVERVALGSMRSAAFLNVVTIAACIGFSILLHTGGVDRRLT